MRAFVIIYHYEHGIREHLFHRIQVSIIVLHKSIHQSTPCDRGAIYKPVCAPIRFRTLAWGAGQYWAQRGRAACTDGMAKCYYVKVRLLQKIDIYAWASGTRRIHS